MTNYSGIEDKRISKLISSGCSKIKENISNSKLLLRNDTTKKFKIKR
jgi:hypothetical protein